MINQNNEKMSKKEAIIRASMGNSMLNHIIFLDVDTRTSQTWFIFSLSVDNVEMINP